ncbi:hypothetical protein [Pseudomonas gingeri]|uniref:Uncharacterized protein n=1 Tax=Pseudomonas gingeri TaxID=117681 RepID=A0A7Y7WEI6_9PSED|nr:hypothetical protein [Pseudomonas gingeri]NWB47913.1 hypothetical protein [Pseudomonas gingeri]
MRCVLALTLFYLPTLAFSDCQERLPKWAETLHPNLIFDKKHSVCKASSLDQSRTLAALAFIESHDGDDDTTYGLEVLSADSDTIRSHIYESAAISSDAVQFDGLGLDTARYQIATATRAFGVRVKYLGSSRIYRYWSTELNLYVDDGQKLHKIFGGLEVDKVNGEWDGNCEGNSSETTSSVAIGKALNKGYTSLEITDKTIDYHSVAKGGDCIYKNDKPVLKKHSLIYNGR